MTSLDFSGFANRKPLSAILEIPPKVQSVYSLTQHVWAGDSADERLESKKKSRVRLETLDEFLIDPVRNLLNRFFERVADNEGQGWWLQAEFGVGKSHVQAVTSILAVGGPPAWERIKQREDAEKKKAGPGARLDSLWRKKLEKRKIFPIVFSLEGVGGTATSRVEDFILREAQETFALREGKPLAVYPEEHLANLFLREHQKQFKDDLRTFLADRRLMRGLPSYEYDELMKALKQPESQRDAGRVLLAFYNHKSLQPKVPTERGERLSRMASDILNAGYDGIFVAIDEMSEYLRKSSQQTAEDEDCLLILTNKLAKADALPIWTLVAAQMAHTNPQKIIAPDRLSQETLEHKPERFRDIVVQRTRTVTDKQQVKVYYDGYRNLIPWVKDAAREDFEAAFPFPPDAIQVIRAISTKLTGTRSTISFLHRALQNAAKQGAKELVPLWRVFDDLMSYAETPSTASTGTVSIRSRFRSEVAALEAAQNTLKRITDGQLARPQNKIRAERILNTLFLYHIAGVPGLTKEQILDAVSDLKPGEDELEAQLAHYENILEEMRGKLRNQIRFQQGRYHFMPKETSQYDDLVYQATDALKSDRQLLDQWLDRLLAFADEETKSPFTGFVSEAEGSLMPLKVEDWHGQERSGRVRSSADLPNTGHASFEIDTHGKEDDFLVVLSRRAMTDRQVENWLKKDKPADPRLVVWAPAPLSDDERGTVASVLAHLKVAEDDPQGRYAKDGRREFKREAHRAFTALQGIYGRGVARVSRGPVSISLVGGVEGALATMAKEAMETCYRSREIDFGKRRFDTPNAVKLINGLVRRGMAVSEGDALWSAVENFAAPLGLVRPEAPKRLDPSGSKFYREIRQKIEERAGMGLDVRTVYNWFTGYNIEDGKESAGLTRRMVDIYLLCLAQQGVIRITQSKGGYIDRSTIASIEFKPDVLRGMSRIELPRAPQDWEVFHPYLEVMTGKPASSLGPKYEKAAADEALRAYWEQKWVDRTALERIDQDVRELYQALGKADKNPFDDLLLYWQEFAEEGRPEPYAEDEAFNWLRRSVLKASAVAQPDDLTAEHLERFSENHRRLSELQESFGKTSVLLLRAAKLASALLPDGAGYDEIRRAQGDVRKELEDCQRMILNPDSVNTRLAPRLNNLEQLYVESYLNELMCLDSIQGQLAKLAEDAGKTPQLEALADFAGDVPEARRVLDAALARLAGAPPQLRRPPEDRDRAEKDVRQQACVRDVQSQDLTFRRLRAECQQRFNAQSDLAGVPGGALNEFGAFLISPGVLEQLKTIGTPPAELSELLRSNNAGEAAECLLTMPSKKRRDLAKLFKALLGKKKGKAVALSGFRPTTDVIWEKGDIARLTSEFEQFIERQWEDGAYLKIEK